MIPRYPLMRSNLSGVNKRLTLTLFQLQSNSVTFTTDANFHGQNVKLSNRISNVSDILHVLRASRDDCCGIGRFRAEFSQIEEMDFSPRTKDVKQSSGDEFKFANECVYALFFLRINERKTSCVYFNLLSLFWDAFRRNDTKIVSRILKNTKQFGVEITWLDKSRDIFGRFFIFHVAE